MENLVSTHKTIINAELVLIFLQGQYQTEVTNLQFITGGEGSQAFSFEVDGGQYVIRVNRHSAEGFKKDEYAYKHFNFESIPIPEILNIGQMDNGYYFAISKKVDGILARDVPKENIADYVTPSAAVLEAIHAIPIDSTTGYGKWDSTGNGAHSTWKEFLKKVDMYAVGNDENPSLFTNSFLEQDVWNELFQHFVSALEYCPEGRWLLHGDYGFDNLFVKEGKVVGVIDWEHSMYGDFLYDVAWLSFWSQGFGYKEWYKNYYQSQGKQIPHFEKRLLCYELYIGLGSLSFYAYSNQKDKYERSKTRLYAIIQNGS